MFALLQIIRSLIAKINKNHSPAALLHAVNHFKIRNYLFAIEMFQWSIEQIIYRTGIKVIGEFSATCGLEAPEIAKIVTLWDDDAVAGAFPWERTITHCDDDFVTIIAH